MRQLAALSDIEFESLVSDLLLAVTGHAYERFGVGADGGIDLRYVAPEQGSTEVVQCKHYMRSSFTQLLSAARKEVPKLEAMEPAPTSYRFITSQSLTTGQKDKLLEVLNPWLTDPGMIWGSETIEDELDAHDEVERNHVKLWLSSSAHLETLLNAGTHNRSNDLIDRINRALPRYVQTQRFAEAEEMLEKVGVCLIAGEPGIGKTTLAQMLLLDCAQKGFEALYVSEDIGEAWDALGKRSQAFYYDDFLGRIGLAGLRKNEDQRLVDLIAKAQDDPRRTRLILTTREYILRSAVSVYDSFARAGLDHKRFLLALEDYTREERGLVLYNHLYHSEAMRPEWLAQLVESRAYLQIIDHPNYNPRLIEFITGHAKSHELEHIGEDWVAFAIAALEHPEEIWKRAFENELDDLQRSVLICLATIGGSISVADLKEAVRAQVEAAGGSFHPRAFSDALQMLEITFIAFGHRSEEPTVDVANPSISDFILNMLAENRDALRVLLQGAEFFAQPRQLIEVTEAEGDGELSEKMAAALTEEATALVDALMRTIASDEVRRRAQMREGRIRVRDGIEAEERLQIFVRSSSELLTEGEGRGWLEEQLRALVHSWEQGVIDRLAAIALHRDLVERLPRELAEITGPALKTALAGRSEDAERYRQIDLLWEADPALFEIDERSEWIGQFSEYTDWALHEEISQEELTTIERMADSFGVDLDPEALEEAEERIAQRDWEPEVDEDDWRERGDEEPSRGDDDSLNELFERLTSEPEAAE